MSEHAWTSLSPVTQFSLALITGLVLLIAGTGALSKIRRLLVAGPRKTSRLDHDAPLILSLALLTELVVAVSVITGVAEIPAMIGLSAYVVATAMTQWSGWSDDSEVRFAYFVRDMSAIASLAVLAPLAFALRVLAPA